MNTKQMREELKAADKHVPRSNADLISAYNDFKGVSLDFEPVNNVVELVKSEPEIEVIEAESVDEVWTYIGAGHQPPQVINFMGRESFTRGVAKNVTDNKVLAELNKNGNKSFVSGRVNPEDIIKQDEAEEKIYQHKLREDALLQSKMKAFR